MRYSLVPAEEVPCVRRRDTPLVCYNTGVDRVMNIRVRESLTMPTITTGQVIERPRQLSPVEQRWLALHLQEHLETTLPERATLDEAVELYLADACSLGRAAELAGVTRWDVLDALKARGEMQRPTDVRSADEIDDLAE